LEYKVTGLALFIPIDGTLRLDIDSVEEDGYTMTLTPSGIPGMTVETEFREFSEPIGVSETDDSFVKNGTQSISTEFGKKNVDRYELIDFENGTTSIYYIGVDTNSLYRAEVTGEGFTMTIELTDTNIDIIKNNDKA
jgi:hypothetical protein